MTTLLGKDKSVEYSLSTEILLRDNMFRLEPIKIACSSKKDAEYIQEKVNKLNKKSFLSLRMAILQLIIVVM